MSASDVDTEMRTIRDMLSADIFTDNIQRHGLEWEMACASMDVIEDAQLAIDAFDRKPVSEEVPARRVEHALDETDLLRFLEVEHAPDETDLLRLLAGQRYLEVYGLFQAFFLQQDAIRHLAAALKLGEPKDPDLKEVRDLRNKFFGHPSKHDRQSPTTYHGLTRVTVTTDEITGWTYGPRFSTKTISINAEIAKQAEGATRVLGQLRRELGQLRHELLTEENDLPPADLLRTQHRDRRGVTH
jgi:hypothetical protein